jgi:hypothetical protein
MVFALHTDRGMATSDPATVRSCGGRTFVAMLLLVGAIGCTPMIRQPNPQLSGTFTGTGDGHSVTLTVQQAGSTVTGNGVWGDRPFGLSALTAPQGPMVLSFASGGPNPGRITLSPDGQTITIRGLGAPLQLARGGTPVIAPDGPFSGRFVLDGPIPVRLDLNQGGDLVAGTGYFSGKAVAVVGRLIEANRARGTVLYSDESRNRVTVTLSADQGILVIEGLGAPIRMTRE